MVSLQSVNFAVRSNPLYGTVARHIGRVCSGLPKEVTSSTYEWLGESAPTPEKRDYGNWSSEVRTLQTGRQCESRIGRAGPGRAELLDGYRLREVAWLVTSQPRRTAI